MYAAYDAAGSSCTSTTYYSALTSYFIKVTGISNDCIVEKNTTLTDSGPYAWVRNPLYLGTLTTAAGLVIAARRWELGILFAAVFLLVYLPVVELEEQHLRGLFQYFPEYAARVPKLLPRFTPANSGKVFRWSLYRKNREYEALIGFLAGSALLFWKATY